MTKSSALHWRLKPQGSYMSRPCSEPLIPTELLRLITNFLSSFRIRPFPWTLSNDIFTVTTREVTTNC